MQKSKNSKNKKEDKLNKLLDYDNDKKVESSCSYYNQELSKLFRDRLLVKINFCFQFNYYV